MIFGSYGQNTKAYYQNFRRIQAKSRTYNAHRVPHLIAGYVKMVAMVFEIAPNRKAENAERAKGEEPTAISLCFLFRSLCLS